MRAVRRGVCRHAGRRTRRCTTGSIRQVVGTRVRTNPAIRRQPYRRNRNRRPTPCGRQRRRNCHRNINYVHQARAMILRAGVVRCLCKVFCRQVIKESPSNHGQFSSSLNGTVNGGGTRRYTTCGGAGLPSYLVVTRRSSGRCGVRQCPNRAQDGYRRRLIRGRVIATIRPLRCLGIGVLCQAGVRLLVILCLVLGMR